MLIGSASLMTALVASPLIAAAQHGDMGSARHEFGVDVSAAYVHQSFVGTSLNSFVIVTPVDVRLGFVSKGRLMFEPRFAFLFDSKATGTSSGYVFTPDVNVLYAKNHRDGQQRPVRGQRWHRYPLSVRVGRHPA